MTATTSSSSAPVGPARPPPAERGLEVLLVDRTLLPADTLSTHALLLGATIQLRRWGLLDEVAATGATPVSGVTIEAGPTRFVAPIKHIGGVDTVYGPQRAAHFLASLDDSAYFPIAAPPAVA